MILKLNQVKYIVIQNKRQNKFCRTLPHGKVFLLHRPCNQTSTRDLKSDSRYRTNSTFTVEKLFIIYSKQYSSYVTSILQTLYLYLRLNLYLMYFYNYNNYNIVLLNLYIYYLYYHKHYKSELKGKMYLFVRNIFLYFWLYIVIV